ncbi:sugar ABC transporter permease [uncultured Meiothermus sp.]|jgi:arabinogalactan oligomer/maltooligosaccharide transport system permease protein|uniref:sugar ABC transporter permease n=1 Tax=uncultured Meiothermus sp. TaxID=157471 RepID=UPI00262D6941|nr:sugar ABC transporter permease [uncultured Meiothermus sp.]
MAAVTRYIGWAVVGIGVAWVLFVYFPSLLARIQPNTPPGFIRVEHGWVYVLGGLLAIIGLILLYALLVTRINNMRHGRRRSPFPLFGQGLTHLFMAVVILLAYYPVLQILAASFDPRNTLYRILPPASDNLLVRARVIPDFSQLSWENYAQLFDGFILYAYQAVLMTIAALSLLIFLTMVVYRRITGDDRSASPYALIQGRSLTVFAILGFILVIFLSPEQFTGPATESKFVLWVRNTLFVSGVTGLVAVLLTATAGYAFARFSFPGRYPMLLVFIFVQMFPGFLGLVATYFLISSLGLLNTFTGLVLAYTGGIISFGTWVYKGFLESISRSLEEAALIDGASKWQAFTLILLPLSAPMFVFIFLLQFVGTYSEFIMANLLLTGVDSWTVGMGLRNFTTGQFSTKWGLFAAAAVLGSLPILATFYGFQRYFVSGYTAGSVKE